MVVYTLTDSELASRGFSAAAELLDVSTVAYVTLRVLACGKISSEDSVHTDMSVTLIITISL